MASIFKVIGFYAGICDSKHHILRNLAAFTFSIEKNWRNDKKNECEKELVYYHVEVFPFEKPSKYEVMFCCKRVSDGDGVLSITEVLIEILKKEVL